MTIRKMLAVCAALCAATGISCASTPPPAVANGEGGTRTIKARVQPRPGAEVQDIDMEIRPVPTELTVVPADSVDLDDDDLVVGVMHAGFVVAYPIRFLAQYEIVGDNLNGLAIAPSW